MTTAIVGTYPRSAAQQFIDAMGDSRNEAVAQQHAERLGGGEVCHMSYRFKDASAAYLTDQAGWKLKD